MVPWLSTENQCTNHIKKLGKHEPIVQWLRSIVTRSIAGFQYQSESCLNPCATISVQAKLAFEMKSVNGDAFSAVHFDETVGVKTLRPSYTFADLVVEMGSSLGLWLGLSMIGLWDVCVFVTARLAAACRGKPALKTKH